MTSSQAISIAARNFSAARSGAVVLRIHARPPSSSSSHHVHTRRPISSSSSVALNDPQRRSTSPTASSAADDEIHQAASRQQPQEEATSRTTPQRQPQPRNSDGETQPHWPLYGKWSPTCFLQQQLLASAAGGAAAGGAARAFSTATSGARQASSQEDAQPPTSPSSSPPPPPPPSFYETPRCWPPYGGGGGPHSNDRPEQQRAVQDYDCNNGDSYYSNYGKWSPTCRLRQALGSGAAGRAFFSTTTSSDSQHKIRRGLSSSTAATTTSGTPASSSPFSTPPSFYETPRWPPYGTGPHHQQERKQVVVGDFDDPLPKPLPPSYHPAREGVEGPHGKFVEQYATSVAHPEEFWAEAAKRIRWFREPTKVLEKDPENEHLYRWFPDGVLNACYECLDVHVWEEGRGDQPAIYYDSPVTGSKQTITYAELLEEVSTLAGGLRDLGVEQGDRVVIYMPMVPQALAAMLACARIGAVHSVVFGGFAAPELATRIADCRPKVVISASCGKEPTRVVEYKPLLDKALEIAREKSGVRVDNVVVVQRPDVLTCDMVENRDVDYDELLAKSSPVDAVPLPANHPHYILYTSGTTGTPKGIVRDTAGHAVALKYTMGAFYDTNPGDVFLAASDIGWVVGHSYSVYGPLLNGCTTVLYEGKPIGTPDAGAFWRLVEEYKIRTLFAAPTAFRAMKQADPEAKLAGEYDLSSLNALYLAGEHSDPDTLQFCQTALRGYGDVQYPIDHWWQTELGHPGVGNALGLGRMPLRPGGCTAPAPGYDISIVDEETGLEVPQGELGDMVIRTPLPPGTLATIYNNDQGYVDSYLTKYPGFYDTGDAAYVDEDGYIHIMGRTDDLINVAGHRLSTGGLEEVLQSHPEVADCAVLPVKDTLKGQLPVGFVVTNAGSAVDEEQLKADLVRMVRETVGPVACFKKVAVVSKLPKTRSGKILRGTMSKIANGEEYKITPTVEDPDVFTYLEPIIQDLVGVQSRS